MTVTRCPATSSPARERLRRLSPITSPIFIIAGPTAVGKSDLAVAIAERCAGEIVGADAFQIYRGLDTLTAKPPPDLRARVPHHLIDEIPLTQSFDVAHYLDRARQQIAEIQARGKPPIVVGGTGLYLRALTHGLADLPAADPALRAELERQPLSELQRQLTEMDPLGATQIDLKNPRRLIRALEVCKLTGRPFSSFREQWSTPTPHLRGIVLSLDRVALHDRINRRTETMFARGVVEEVREIGDIGPTASQTIGLREIQCLIAGGMSRSDCIAAIQQATRQYAKRQMTWFRRESSLTALDVSDIGDFDPLADSLAKAVAA